MRHHGNQHASTADHSTCILKRGEPHLSFFSNTSQQEATIVWLRSGASWSILVFE